MAFVGIDRYYEDKEIEVCRGTQNECWNALFEHNRKSHSSSFDWGVKNSLLVVMPEEEWKSQGYADSAEDVVTAQVKSKNEIKMFECTPELEESNNSKLIPQDEEINTRIKYSGENCSKIITSFYNDQDNTIYYLFAGQKNPVLVVSTKDDEFIFDSKPQTEWVFEHKENELEDIFCEHCLEMSPNITKTDVGIGPYEYWGAKDTHEEMIEATQCCHSGCVNKLLQPVNTPEIAPEESEPDYDEETDIFKNPKKKI